METNLSLTIRRSRWLLVYLLLLHCLMVWTLWQIDIAGVIVILLTGLLLFSLWYQLGRYQWRSSGRAVVAVSYQAPDHNTNESWDLFYSDKRLVGPFALVSSVVLEGIVIMRFRKGFLTRWWMRHEAVLILAGNVDAEAFRKLRVMLRQHHINSADVR